MQTIYRRNSIKTRITAAMLGIFFMGIWSLYFYTSQTLRLDMERLLGQQQSTAVSFMANEVNQELKERVTALEMIAAKINAAVLADPEEAQKFLAQRPILENFFNAGLQIIKSDAVTPTHATEGSELINPMQIDPSAIRAVLSTGKTLIGRPIIDPILKQPLFSIAAPIFDTRRKIIGALIGTTNLGKTNFLDRISASQDSKNGQYQLLIAPQYRLVITSSDKTRVMETIPGPGLNPAIDRFIKGYEGSAITINPKGLEVLSTSKSIPVAGWFMVISLPVREVFAPIREMQRTILLPAILLTLLAGGLIFWILKRQLTPLTIAAESLSRMSAKNQPPQALSAGKPDEIGILISSFNQLLLTLKKREDALGQSEKRLADILDNVDANIYLKDLDGRYLFANQSVRKVLGSTIEQIIGQDDEAFFDAKSAEQLRVRERPVFIDGETFRGEEYMIDLKSGRASTYLSVKLPLRDANGDIYALCGISTDITEQKLQEQQEQQGLRDQIAHRDVLVREVHHRIKNNLQGIIGILRQFAQKYPAIAEPANQAISQVHSISVIYGLQGRANSTEVQLGELTCAIAEEIQSLWQTPVKVDLSSLPAHCVVAENEAVPVALILNELILNAVKHGGKAHVCVNIALPNDTQHNLAHAKVMIEIVNSGQFSAAATIENNSHNGLQLVSALMPPFGAALTQVQQGEFVVTTLELSEPVIFIHQQETK